GLLLTLDGRPLTLTVASTSASSTLGQSNLPILRLETTYEAAVPEAEAQGAHAAIAFRDVNDVGRLGWREIVLHPSEGAHVEAPTGYVERSKVLREYPSSSLNEAPDEREVEFTWVVGSGAAARPATSAAPTFGGAVVAAGFERLISHQPTLETLWLSLLAAAGFGALHAFGPGHGKSLVAAYLIGTRGTPRHAVALGLTVTATHTAAVYAIGGAALLASASL